MHALLRGLLPYPTVTNPISSVRIPCACVDSSFFPQGELHEATWATREGFKRKAEGESLVVP